MKLRVQAIACMLFAALAAFACIQSSSPPPNELIGVWKVTEVKYPEHAGLGPNPLDVMETQPSIAIFTKKHFSMTVITGKESRVNTPKDPTKEQLMELFRTFSSIAGTYEVKGSILTAHLSVSWLPLYMNTQVTYEIRFEGDNLVLTTASKDPKMFSITTKYTRLE